VLIRSALNFAKDFISSAIANPRPTRDATKMLEPFARGLRFGRIGFSESRLVQDIKLQEPNPLLSFFNAQNEGPGIWKWVHYFDIYYRHFQRFVGRKIHVMEVGVYSGGSLAMWRDFFGPACRVYGVDIEPGCLIYKSENIDILIGNQGDRSFWRNVKQTIPKIDVFIDDGGHHPEHQLVTLEEMLPHIAPGGVYLCEDIHGCPHYFASYLCGLASTLNSGADTDFLKAIESVHFYPYIGVIEKTAQLRTPLTSERRGTQWQPFL
jgi:hypothetical protein